MLNRVAPALAATAWLTAAAASAQPAPASTMPAPASSVAPLTVQAAPAPDVVRRQARSFVQSYAAPTGKIDQIARWHDAVCVQVEGVVAEQAGRIQARVEEVARGVGLKVMKPGCRSNIQIVFTDQPQRLLDKFAERGEPYLGYHYRADLKKVKAVTRPVQAWYMTATQGDGNNAGAAFAVLRDAFGNPVYNPGGLAGQTTLGETLDNPENPTPTGCADSPHFTACLQSLFKNVFIVADSHAVEGRDLGAMADYLAMLALSQPRSLDGCSALPSVIDLMAKAACPDRDSPDGLTAADASYLTSLYASDPQAKLSGAQGDIAGRMAKILVRAAAQAK